MIDLRSQKSYDCNDLRKIVHILRSPGGCQWDQAQTHQSIRRNFLEEAYEVAEAIDEGDLDHLKEELGDVLLQVVFHSSIEEDAGRFDPDDVADGVNAAKLGYVDDVIEPAQTRQMIAAALEMLSGKRESRPAKKHGNMPL